MALDKKEIIINNEEIPEIPIDSEVEHPRDVYIAMVLDSSGSMYGLVDQVIESVNSFLQSQSEIPARTIATLCDFNSSYSFPFLNVEVQDVDRLTRESYRPGGSTALYDAIMATQQEVDKYLEGQPGLDVIFVIVTDGQENSSINNARNNVFDMIREKTDNDNWVFTYLSADADAFAAAGNIGISSINTVQWAATNQGFEAGTLTSNLATTSYRYSRGMSYNLSDAANQVISSSNLDPGALKTAEESGYVKDEDEDGGD